MNRVTLIVLPNKCLPHLHPSRVWDYLRLCHHRAWGHLSLYHGRSLVVHPAVGVVLPGVKV